MKIVIALWRLVVGRVIKLVRPVRRRLGWAALLPAVAALYLTIWGVHTGTLVFIVIALAAALAIPVIAADLLPLALIYLGLHWLVYALVHGSSRTSFLSVGVVFRPVAWALGTPQTVINSTAVAPGKALIIHPVPVPVPVWTTLAPALSYGKGLSAAYTTGQSGQWTVVAGFEVAAGVALLLFGGWLVPRTIGMHTRIMRRNGELSRRVRTLTATRVDAIDTAAAELRRVERDLHDGAQARLVAVGMSLRAMERLIRSDPDAAMSLVAEARENSARALADLRGLVRGINPPVLVERGLGDAIEALALDTPIPATLDINLDGRAPAPVESAVYFAVAEVLATAVKHADAHGVHIRAIHTVAEGGQGMLRVEITDDGSGGADPASGTGLTGIERRLGTFDGILAVSSPPGGPTLVVIEVPCALSSPKISSCLERACPACSSSTASRSPRRSTTVRACWKPSRSTSPTSRSSTSGCRLPIPMRACAPPWRRGRTPGLPILILSAHVEQLYARELLADQAGGVGYLLKDRVFTDEQFTDALYTVARGGTVMDPEVVAKLLAKRPSQMTRLSQREREVLALMAEGRSNSAIAQRLFITEKAVSKHCTSIFAKLDLPPDEDDNRRVLAVLAYLNS